MAVHNTQGMPETFSTKKAHADANLSEALNYQSVQAVSMSNVDVTLVVGKPTATQTQLKSNILRVDPGGTGTPDLILPTEATLKGITLEIYNSGTGTRDFRVRDDGDASTLLTLVAGEGGQVTSDGTSLSARTGTAGGADDFGSSGIAADVIAESTAAAGVTVDGLLVKDGSVQAAAVADPGNGGAIVVTKSGVCAMTSAGAETRTVAIPTFIGQRLVLVCDTYVGNIVVTVAAAYNVSNHTILTFGAVSEACELVGVSVGGAKVWQIGWNDNVGTS
jgi:hypothetical protein